MKCVICGDEVSKRQSLAYKDGRACRKHEEVMKMQAEELERQSWAKVERNLSKMFLVEAVRVQMTVGFPRFMIEEKVRRMCAKNGDKFLCHEIMEEAEEKGKLTQKEIAEAMMTAVILNERKERTHEN